MMYGTNGMDPKAQKRFSNDQARASQSSLTSLAAKQSIPNPNTNVRPQVNVPKQQLPRATPGALMSRGSSQQPVPQVPMGEPVDPVQTMQNNMDLESFLSSPTVQDALSRSRLRQYFKRNDPTGVANDVAFDALSNMLHNT